MLHVTGDEPGSAGTHHPADPVRHRHRAALTWSAFQEWRRVRPFWGGLFLVASGIEFYLSGHLDLLPMKVSFGPQSFLGWLIPLALLLCGLLTWYTPAQRVFYGILGAVISVAALIGLNLGGFFVGMLLGVVGGALAFSWTPDESGGQRPDEPEPVLPDEPEWAVLDQADPAAPDLAQHRAPDEAESATLDLPQGAGPDDPPSGPASRLTALFLLTVAATALLALPARPAAAAPCPPPVTPSTAPSATPSSSPTPDPVSDFFRQLGRLLGIGGTATPSPSGSPSTPAPGQSCTPPSAPAPAPSKRVRTLAVPPGQPLVNSVPSKQITALLSQTGLSYDGIVDLPTHTGTLRALQFSIRSSTSTPFELQVPAPGGTILLRSSKLTVSGHVRFYTTEIKGKLFGVLPVTFTPDSPPPLVVPDLFFTDATVHLVFVHCDLLTAPSLRIGYR